MNNRQIACIKIPVERKYKCWKIRSKKDAHQFLDECLSNGYFSYVSEDYVYAIDKDETEISLSCRHVSYTEWYDPFLEIANTNKNCYEETVYDVVWKTRKAINKKYFSEED